MQCVICVRTSAGKLLFSDVPTYESDINFIDINLLALKTFKIKLKKLQQIAMFSLISNNVSILEIKQFYVSVIFEYFIR